MFPILSPSKLFNPLEIPGIFAWFHANSWDGFPTLNPLTPAPIATWLDLCPPNAYSFQEADAGKQPIFTPNFQNGHPGIVFPAGSNLTGPAAFLSNVASGVWTIYMVMSASNLSANLPLIAVDDDLFNRFNFIVPNATVPPTVYLDYGNVFGGQRLVVTEADVYTGAYAHCFQANTPVLNIFRNNTLRGTNNGAGTFTPGIKVPHMAWELSGAYTMYEMICCNQAHDSATMAQVFSYLNNYWGLYQL